MECSINIGHFKVNFITNNANINFESTYQNSHTANSTVVGGCFNFGDQCINSCTQDPLLSSNQGPGSEKDSNNSL
jgi:hypothetical protein